MPRLSEECGIAYVLKPGDYQAGVDGDSINTEGCSHVTFILQTAVLTGDAVLKIYSGATDGAKTTAETFVYRLAGADEKVSGSDVYGAAASSAALTLTAATYDNKILVVEVPVSSLTAGPFVTLNIDAAADAFNASCVAILCGLRYKGASMQSAIA